MLGVLLGAAETLGTTETVGLYVGFADGTGVGLLVGDLLGATETEGADETVGATDTLGIAETVGSCDFSSAGTGCTSVSKEYVSWSIATTAV